MTTIQINRAPVMTLWAAVVAERLGYKREEALTLGRAVAGLNAHAKALRVGIREPASPSRKGAATGERAKPAAKEPDIVELLGRSVPVVRTPKGVRAAKDGKPDSPDAVEKYLAAKFGDALPAARAAMTALAAAHPRNELAQQAYALYESFRPKIPAGARGWGAKGILDLATIADLAPNKAKRR